MNDPSTKREVVEGRFELREVLGTGAFGAVHEAIDLRTQQRVAIKELTHHSPSALARFKQEFRALVDLHHPNLVGIRELLERNGRFLIAMELIEGSDFKDWVSPPELSRQPLPFDEHRLRQALVGVAQGLCALHEHGILHRDLKPSNIRVTAAGEAVLLDFGLVTTSDEQSQSTQQGVLGTATYMAPEQARSEKLGPAADWYAFGVCLYEALTTALPFDASSSLQVMMAKQTALPVAPSTLVPNLPRDLEQLCMKLLAPDPKLRAGAREVAQVLGIETSGMGLIDTSNALAGQELFEGREGELEQLERAANESETGALRIVLVEGESGVGKSALVRQAIQRMRAHSPSAVLLRGRCYENEQVPYKAFDGCMDALARVLKRLNASDSAELVPERSFLLARMFPVLRDVRAIAASSHNDLPLDPTTSRLEAFEVLSTLLSRIARRFGLTLFVDDLQWADAESFRLLRALVESPARAGILILATVRPRAELSVETASALDEVRAWPVTTLLTVHGLPRSQAHALASQLLGEGAPAHWVQAIADESRGHPLFISALAQYAASHSVSRTSTLTLDAALGARFETLKSEARALVDLVALAGRPYGLQVFARALDRRQIESATKELLVRKLIVLRADGSLDCFHNRIRQVAVGLISRASLPEKHRALARALEEDRQVEASDLARHWEAAGELAWALGFYERAGDKALESLAFARAESAYARALALLGPNRAEDRRRLLVQRAHALARGGRCKDAALSYREAAQGVEGDLGVRLHIWAAQQLIQAAHLDEGLAAARDVLQKLSVPLPTGVASSLSRIAWDKACTGSFELESKAANVGATAQDDLALDALYQLSLPIGWGEALSGAVLNVHYLRRATRAGVPSHMARALGQLGLMRSLQNPEADEDVAEIFEKARKLGSLVDDPAIEAFQWQMEGTSDLVCNRQRSARDKLSQAARILQHKCPGEPWLTTQVRMGLAAARFQLGEHDRMFDDMKVWLAEADEREDRFARAALVSLGVGGLRHLLNDDPDATREELREALSPWPKLPVVLPHFGEMINVGFAELYRGGAGLSAWFAENEKRLDRAFLFKTAYCGGELAMYRALAALASAASGPRVEQARHLAVAAREAKKSERMRPTVGRPLRALLQAQVSLLEGDKDRALSLARLSLQGLATLELVMQHAAGYLVGLLEGGEVGAQRCDRALGALAAQRWKVPERVACVWVPAARTLESPRQLRRPAPGLIGGRYRLVRTLGRGGFGVVAEAEDARTHTRVALKELSRTSPAALARFKREFRVLQDLHHPNLVRLDGMFAHEGRFFIAMELLNGKSFVDYVREQGTCDEARLRSALLDLTAGLSALHEAGFLHRDLTPRNVLVTREGRAVLLDFGLVGDRRASEDSSGWVGTLAYVSPEQIQGDTLDSASDAYAVGVCMYEAITGELPFEAGSAAEILRLKLRRSPMAPRSFGVDVSADLEQVCLALLAVDPRDRPTLADLRARLSPANADADDASIMREAAFAGRGRELRGLHAGFARALGGEPTLFLVVGESGVGKTALVAELLRELREGPHKPLLLSGRCYENEQVAYKAFDGAMDELARHLRRLSHEACTALLPEGAPLLTQLFPVFESVDAFVFAETSVARVDPTARRMHAFEALSGLFSRMREQGPIVLVIDDLQWADAESFRLLRALLEGSRPPALFILATLRPTDEQSQATREQIEALSELTQVSAMAVAELNDADARTLALRLLGTDASDVRLEAVVREGRGHPLFIAELSALASVREQAPQTDMLTLDEALARRVNALSDDARAWLEVIAIAGRPVGAHLCARVLGDEGEYASTVASLLAQRLVRRGRDAELTCYHDRLRRVVLDAMRRARYSTLCGLLAAAMEDELHGDSAERAKLWCGAGELGRASLAYEDAGDSSLELLAFAHAEEFYGRALELLSDTDGAPRRQRLFEQRGHALSRAGRSAEAAFHYQEAAATAEGEAKIRLRTRAAQQLLQSAQVDEGMRAARTILAELDVYVPTGTAGALTRLAWDRTWLSLRGLEVEIARGEIPREERLVLDTVSDLSLPMGWVDILAGSALNAQHLRRALTSGDPEHVVRALAQEAAFVAMQNPQRLEGANELFDRARELSAGTSPSCKAHRLFMEGTASLLTYQLARCLDVSEHAERVIETECAGEPWLLTNVRVNLGAGMLNTGSHAALVRRSRRWLDEATERRDRFSLAVLSGLAIGYLVHLTQDSPQRALDELREAIAPWPSAPLSLTHIGNIWAEVACALYQGGNGAHAVLERESARVGRSVVARGGFVSEWFSWLEGTALLQLLGERAEQSEVLPKLDACIRRLAKPGTMFATPVRELLLAQREFVTGNMENARNHALAAERGLSTVGSAHAWSATYLLGVIEGGDSGKAKREWILARLRREGWKNPRRAIATLGFGLSGD